MGCNQGFLFRCPIRFFFIITIAPAGIGTFQRGTIFLGTLCLRFLMFLNSLIMVGIELVIIIL